MLEVGLALDDVAQQALHLIKLAGFLSLPTELYRRPSPTSLD